VHTQPVYATGQRLPVAESLSAQGLSLPSAVTLAEDEIARVVNAIQAVRRAPEPART
jgi:perosamine synthetase